MERAIGPAKCGWPDPHVSVLLDVFSELKDLLRSYGPIPELFNQGSVDLEELVPAHWPDMEDDTDLEDGKFRLKFCN
ncbi:hypothetical protein SETIT_7G133200v2 [Setaria italica]|uniref:Uncharacterized protein n=1 Tax=Setaria italica TaxID=4555 RepID=A0A368RV84_SETIT|nr:hypothetical protein SETIT_7G133200v2 [Setaria italica]